MKTELEVRRELKLIRSREDPGGNPIAAAAYGAQQALIWMLGTGMAPSDLLKAFDRVAADLEREEA